MSSMEENAIGFLQHDKVKNSATANKVAFLRKKGMSNAQIAVAYIKAYPEDELANQEADKIRNGDFDGVSTQTTPTEANAILPPPTAPASAGVAPTSWFGVLLKSAALLAITGFSGYKAKEIMEKKGIEFMHIRKEEKEYETSTEMMEIRDQLSQVVALMKENSNVQQSLNSAIRSLVRSQEQEALSKSTSKSGNELDKESILGITSVHTPIISQDVDCENSVSDADEELDSQRWEDAVKTIVSENSPEITKKALAYVSMLLSKLVKAPDNKVFHKISTSNKTYKDRVQSVVGAADLFESLGFTKGSHDAWELSSPSEKHISMLGEAQSRIHSVLN